MQVRSQHAIANGSAAGRLRDELLLLEAELGASRNVRAEAGRALLEKQQLFRAVTDRQAAGSLNRESSDGNNNNSRSIPCLQTGEGRTVTAEKEIAGLARNYYAATVPRR
ncbi:unnamed protein product [Lampetra planeri]